MFVTNIDMFITKLKCVIEFEQTLCCRTLDQITISMTMHKEINTLYTYDDKIVGKLFHDNSCVYQ